MAFTSLDKIMYPDAGITKGEVIEFYRRIAPRLLPFLREPIAALARAGARMAKACGTGDESLGGLVHLK